MAMEYIYLDCTTTQPVELKKFNGLRYCYEEECYDSGTLELIDAQGQQKAFFRVKAHTCYVLQRRNQSALQLHEVTPPRPCRERVPWLFGFGSKQRCDSRAQLNQVCQEYQVTHPGAKVVVKDINNAGSYLVYAFAVGKFTTPVAYWREWAENGTWAFFGDDTICEFIAEMYRDFGSFRYPLQFVIHQVRGMATGYPIPTRTFFQEKLGCYDRDVYYADSPDAGF